MTSVTDCNKFSYRLLTVAGIFLLAAAVACENGAPSPASAGEEGYVELEDTRLYYQTMGEGEPLMVVHGGPLLDHGYLEPWLEDLSSEYRLVFMDQRLSGRSSPESDSANVRMGTFADDIEAVRLHLGLERVHLMGHSWGGYLAMHYALEYPAALRSLVLVSPMPPSSAQWQAEQQALARQMDSSFVRERRQILASDEFRADPNAAREKLLRHSFRPQFNDPSLADSLDLHIPDDYERRSGLFSLLSQDLQSFDLYPRLEGLRVPALVLYGDQEPAATISGPSLARTLPQATLRILERTGHFSFMERPALFQEEVRTFLSDH